MRDDSEQTVLQEILTSTPVEVVCRELGATREPGDTIASAAAEMRRHSHGSALVCSGGKLVGIFTERDLLKLVAAGQDFETPLSEVMTAKPRTISAKDTLFEAIRLMDQGGYRRLPVVDESGAPVGIADVKTIVHYLVEHFPTAVYTQASHAQQTAKAPEGA